MLEFDAVASGGRIGGVGGVTESVRIATIVGLPQDDGGTAVFRGQYTALTELESLDMSVLGRDIMDMFAIIIDRPDGIVTLIREHHADAIETANG